MALLQKLKELLGIGGGDDRQGRRDTEVTVERESGAASEPEAADESEARSEAGPEADSGAGSEAEPDAGPEAEPGAESEPESETAASESGSRSTGEETGAETGSGSDTDRSAEADDGEPVENIKGIGPAYAERLEGVGITTVQELAAADPESIADGTGIGAGRAETWIDRATERQ
ncbi:MAG: helix-hairpin-helix domain-containing protein [Haloferacaceae archaeon]